MATASPASRPIGVATICAAIGLAFCFIIGLAGGTAYKLWSAAAPKPQLADAAGAATAAPASPEIAAVPAPPAAADIAAKAAPAQPFAAPPALPSPPPRPVAAARAPAPPAPAVVPPPAPVAVASAPPPQAAPAPAPSQHAEAAPPPPAAKPHVAAAPAPHPAATGMPVRLAATPAHPAPGTQSASLQSPPAAAALADRTGPFLIQFGAFAEEANARHVQWAIEATGLKVAVSEAKGAGGHPLYLLRSADYPDYAAAAGAAQSVREHVKKFANPIAIDYAIEADRSETVQVQADAH